MVKYIDVYGQIKAADQNYCHIDVGYEANNSGSKKFSSSVYLFAADKRSPQFYNLQVDIKRASHVCGQTFSNVTRHSLPL